MPLATEFAADSRGWVIELAIEFTISVISIAGTCTSGTSGEIISGGTTSGGFSGTTASGVVITRGGSV